MSRYNLRDVSERLTKSRTIESVISEFLRTLQAIRSDWRASLGFYEVSRDALVDVYELDEARLIRRNIVVPVDRLPHRLVRKIFQATAPLGDHERGSLASSKDATACYHADLRDASELQPLTVLAEWQSCICLPLGYQDDLIAMLTLVSSKKNSFAGRALAEILPVKSVATVSLAQHLYRSARTRPEPETVEPRPDEGIEQEMALVSPGRPPTAQRAGAGGVVGGVRAGVVGRRGAGRRCGVGGRPAARHGGARRGGGRGASGQALERHRVRS